jgi:hypothetical protein
MRTLFYVIIMIYQTIPAVFVQKRDKPSHLHHLEKRISTGSHKLFTSLSTSVHIAFAPKPTIRLRNSDVFQLPLAVQWLS